MPADIRSFFTSKTPGSAAPKAGPAATLSAAARKKAAAADPSNRKNTAVASQPKPGAKRRLTIADEDDEAEDEEAEISAIPAPQTNRRSTTSTKPSLPKSKEEEAISTSDYFSSSKQKKPSAPEPAPPVSKRAASGSSRTNTNSGTTTTKPLSRLPVVTQEDEAHVDGKDGGDDIFTSEFRRGSNKDDYNEMADSEDEIIPTPTRRARRPPPPPIGDSSEDELEVVKPKAVRAKAPASKPTRSTTAQRKKKAEEPEDEAITAVLDSIPQVRPPTPPPSNGESGKFNYAAVASRTAAAPSGGESSVELPTGEENCLAGLVFVFTGILKRLERGEAQALVKRYGGKVTSAPSSKTSFVVLGDDAGPKKLATIRQHGIRTIDEDGLFELIRKLPAHGGNGKAAVKFREQQAAAEEQIRKQAAEMDKEEKARMAKQELAQQKQQHTTVTNSVASGRPPKADVPSSSKLWTVKYAPTQLSQICGNKASVEKLQRWLQNFHKSQQSGFKKAGPDGSGLYRAVMIHGPPGIGKTTAAHLVAKLEGFDVVESNASDTRSKKLVEQGLRGVLESTSLLGYFAADGQAVDKSKRKMVLIMDEVDGMSAGDRGGVGALAAVCKKTEIPVILICNERKLPKMKPFDYVTFDLPFRRPTADQIRSRISTIAFREKLKVSPGVIDALIEGSGSDIRQVVNMLSAAKIDSMIAADEDGGNGNGNELGFDKGRDMAKSWEKHVMLKPWDIVGKILGGGMFSSSSTATLNDKAELYFNDHEFSPLMLQENYLSTAPIRANDAPPHLRKLKALEMAALAAESISDGDLVDRMIHGPQQHWALMPMHAIFSFVRPASYVAGPMSGRRIEFTKWLGNNSAQQKRERLLKDIQARVRLTGSGSREEVRMQYMPSFWSGIPRRLEREGKDGVDAAIDLMDHYYLIRDDFDSILELGIGAMGNGDAGVKIPTAAKSAFTRIYNSRSHPVAYMKGTPAPAATLSARKAEKPDLEEAVEESDGEELVAEEDGKESSQSDGADADSQDITKDKFIRQPKKKAATTRAATKAKPGPSAKTSTAKKATASAAPKGRGKRKQVSSEDENEDELSDVDDSEEETVKRPAKRVARARK